MAAHVNDQVLIDRFKSSASPESCRLIDFEGATVRPGFVNGSFFLLVTGSAPWGNMRIHLNPLIYSHRPDFWRIEVIGCLSGPVILPEATPFSLPPLPLDGILGTVGIEVVGATRCERIAVNQ